MKGNLFGQSEKKLGRSPDKHEQHSKTGGLKELKVFASSGLLLMAGAGKTAKVTRSSTFVNSAAALRHEP
ncbi:hypothetical protein MON38_01565 [Hymenobacter sp. DH14]|uniref:Uncharacterized protein n=1 Tax=Hymenobacter cyanobacteriorum TaxID=2926463 RepID=A0A9X1VBK7_9BACT|nr:hypothetical protein [Hymenobacter cyanobacteriorum]MCI1186089.1 hypothetical protein [Hymenobacter cyanobacteriorum]